MADTKKAPGGGGVFLRFAWQQFTSAKRIKQSYAAIERFDAIAPALLQLPPGVAPQVSNLRVSASDEGWVSANQTLRRGQSFSVFANGAVWIAKALSVGADPVTALWLRIGGRAPVKKIVAAATTFEAWDEGALEVCLKPPGEWLDESGRFDPDIPRKGATGHVDVVIGVWPGQPQAGLAVLEKNLGFKVAHAQVGRLPPQGWKYLWRIGDGAIYNADKHDGKPCIHVHTHGNVGILQYDVEAPLGDDAVLEWRWKVDRLPSTLPEHIQPTHDYLSIAVEFDNGQDLTYYWSASLPKDTVFKCPLAWWDKRETHWVVRSGAEGLGAWQSERRSLKSDYAQAIDLPMPTKIVRIWLIANSVFQRGHGEAIFADIALTSGEMRRQIV